MNTALNYLNHSPFFECLHKCIILGQNRVFLMLENCSNYWFCVHQKMCHAIITSIIGLNFFHFSSLTSKLTWIFRKIDMKPIVVWRHGFFSRSWDELSMLCMCNWLVLYQGRVIVHQIGYMPIQMSFSENCKIKEFMLCL